jgi:predicted porin
MPSGIVTRLHYSPEVAGSSSADLANAASEAETSSGYDVTIEASGDATPEGLTVYGGLSRTTQEQAGNSALNDDISEWTAGIKYAVGSFTLGYQVSEEDNGRATTTTGYDNTGYGIVFAINDDLSLSYNNYESEQLSTTNNTAEASSLQLAYSSGGLSVRVAE